MLSELEEKITAAEAVKRYIKAIDKGILKVMSKMGISTYQSYCGAQIFDAVGLASEFVAKYFTGTATQIEGIGLAEIAEEAFRRHQDAFGENPVLRKLARGRRRLCLPAPRRGACVVAGSDIEPPACGARQFARQVSRLRRPRQRAVRAAQDHARPVPHPVGRRDGPNADRHRRCRAGEPHRQALFHRRHVLRLDQPRGAHDPGHRHEPHRRQVEHRRRRRGTRPLTRRCPTAIPCARRSSRWPPAASA